MMKILIVLLISFYSSGSMSGEEIEKIRTNFGYVPGEIFEIYNEALARQSSPPNWPYAYYNLPTLSIDFSKYYYDMKFIIHRESKKIISMSSGRTYPNMDVCKNEQVKVKRLLHDILPIHDSMVLYQDDYSSSDGKMSGRVTCTQPFNTEKYPVLILYIGHKQMQNLGREDFDK